MSLDSNVTNSKSSVSAFKSFINRIKCQKQNCVVCLYIQSNLTQSIYHENYCNQDPNGIYFTIPWNFELTNINDSTIFIDLIYKIRSKILKFCASYNFARNNIPTYQHVFISIGKQIAQTNRNSIKSVLFSQCVNLQACVHVIKTRKMRI